MSVHAHISISFTPSNVICQLTHSLTESFILQHHFLIFRQRIICIHKTKTVLPDTVLYVQPNPDRQSGSPVLNIETYLYFSKKTWKYEHFYYVICGNMVADERLYLPFWIAIESNRPSEREHLCNSAWLQLPSIFNIWGLSYDLLWWLWTVTASISHKFCFFILVDGLDCKY